MLGAEADRPGSRLTLWMWLMRSRMRCQSWPQSGGWSRGVSVTRGAIVAMPRQHVACSEHSPPVFSVS